MRLCRDRRPMKKGDLSMKASACNVEQFEPATAEESKNGMAGKLLAQPGVAVLATGADFCTRMVYNAAVAPGRHHRDGEPRRGVLRPLRPPLRALL